MDSIVRDIDWSTVLSDKENLQYQRMSERKKQNTYVYSRAIMFKGSNVEDGGLITGKNLGELFENLTAGYNDSINFNHLPIPFATGGYGLGGWRLAQQLSRGHSS